MEAKKLNRSDKITLIQTESSHNHLHETADFSNNEVEFDTARSVLLTSAGESELTKPGESAGALEASRRVIKFATHLNRVQFLLSCSLVVIVGFLFIKQNSEDQKTFEKDRAAAELCEYDDKPESASKLWHQAIGDAKHLYGKQKLIADMLVRAARNEYNASFRVRDKYQTTSGAIDEKAIARIASKEIIWRKEREDDLKTALKIYRQFSDTKAEQLTVLSDLTPILAEKVKEIDNDRNANGTFVLSSPNSDSTAPSNYKKKGLMELRTSQFESALSDFQEYLDLTHSSQQLLVPVFSKISNVDSGDSKTITRLLPIVCEMIYYNQVSLDDLQVEYEWLDWMIARSGAKSTEQIMSAVAPARHGKIIAYLRYLGNGDNTSVRSRLLEALQSARRAEYKDAKDSIADYIDCLKKSRDLNFQSYGPNAKRTMLSNETLGTAYGINNEFDAAEKCLTSIKSTAKEDINFSRNVAFSLADVYAKEGKANLALAKYAEGRRLEKNCKDLIPTYGIWARIASAYIMAGRYKEAVPAVRKADAESRPGGYTSISSGSPNLLMD